MNIAHGFNEEIEKANLFLGGWLLLFTMLFSAVVRPEPRDVSHGRMSHIAEKD